MSLYDNLRVHLLLLKIWKPNLFFWKLMILSLRSKNLNSKIKRN